MINLVMFEINTEKPFPWSKWKQGLDRYPELTPYSPEMRVGDMTYNHLTQIQERVTNPLFCLQRAIYVSFEDISHLEKLNRVLSPSLVFHWYKMEEDKQTLSRLYQALQKPLKNIAEALDRRVKDILALPPGKKVALAMSQLRHRAKRINKQLESAAAYFPDIDIETPEEMTIENGIIRIKGID